MNGSPTRDTRTTLIRRNYSDFLHNQREKSILDDFRVSKRDFTQYWNWRQKKRKEDDLLKLYVDFIDSRTFYSIHIEERRLQCSDSRTRAVASVVKNSAIKQSSVKEYKTNYKHDMTKVKSEQESHLSNKQALVRRTRLSERAVPLEF